MIKLMLVAGDSTKELSEFLEARGSVEVAFKYDSLYRNAEELRTKIFVFDKLIYVYNNPDANVREDMQVLRSLLLGSTYFNVEEIVFFISKPEVPEEGIEYIRYVANEVPRQAENDRALRIPNFDIKIDEEVLRYDKLYNSLLGMTEKKSTENNFRSIYRVEIGNDSKRAYEPEDTTGVVIEPFTFRRVASYEHMQTIMESTESGELLVEDSKVMGPDKLDVDLGQLKYSDPRQLTKVVVFSGAPKCGATTLSIAMAVSAVSAGLKVMLLDITKNKAMNYLLQAANVPFDPVDLKQALLADSISQEQGVALLHEFDYELRFHVLRYVTQNINRFACDLLLIDANPSDIEEASKILETLSVVNFFASNFDPVSLTEASELFKCVASGHLLVTDTHSLGMDYGTVAPDDIRDAIPNLSTMSKISIWDFNISSEDFYDLYFQ